MTKDGQPYGPIRYKQLVKECYLITKNTGTTYSDVLKMTPTERMYFLEFMAEEVKKSKELIEKNHSNGGK